MANWLERARREIQKTPYRPTAKTAKTLVSSVMAVPQPGDSGISRASIVGNGSIHVRSSTGPEEVNLALSCAYRKFWTTPEETEPLETFQAIHAEIGILEAQIDPVQAIFILAAEAQRFYRETGVCPDCRYAGPLHHGPEGHEG